MNDEIKEINLSEMLFNRDEKLLDCIANLQQEIKEANDSITWWTNRFKAVERDNRELKEELEEEKRIEEADLKTIQNLEEENERLKKRNEEIYKGYMSVVDELTEYAEENERLKEDLKGQENLTKSYCKSKQDYKSRCEKAIEQAKEKIKGYKETIDMLITSSVENKRYEIAELRYRIREQEDLLNILQNGSEKDDK